MAEAPNLSSVERRLSNKYPTLQSCITTRRERLTLKWTNWVQKCILVAFYPKNCSEIATGTYRCTEKGGAGEGTSEKGANPGNGGGASGGGGASEGNIEQTRVEVGC